MSGKSKKRPAKKSPPSAFNLTNQQKEALQGFGRQIGDALKTAADAMKDSKPILELPQSGSDFVGAFLLPDETHEKGDRIVWTWKDPNLVNIVMASYLTADSGYPEEVLEGKPGSRKRDYVIDVLSADGKPMFNLTVEQAKWVADATISAVWWESEWRNRFTPGVDTFEVVDETTEKVVELPQDFGWCEGSGQPVHDLPDKGVRGYTCNLCGRNVRATDTNNLRRHKRVTPK